MTATEKYTATLTRSQVLEIVTESDAAYAAREARLVAEEKDAYARYHGLSPRWPAREGSPQMAGFGTQIGGFVGQERWHAARDLLGATRRVRVGTSLAWSLTTSGGVAAYRYRYDTDLRVGDMGGGVEVEIVTHGVDVSDCPNPAAAIAKVRRAHA